MVVDETAVASVLVPADCLSVAAEKLPFMHAFDGQAVDGLSIRFNIQRIDGAVEFAHEAGLTCILTLDERRSFALCLEHVGGADLDAKIAVGACVGV